MGDVLCVLLIAVLDRKKKEWFEVVGSELFTWNVGPTGSLAMCAGDYVTSKETTLLYITAFRNGYLKKENVS